MKGEDFSLGGELLIRRPAIIYRYNVSPGRIITGKYSPGENFLGGDLATGHRHESRTVCCRKVQLMPTLFLKLTKIRQRENGKFVDFNDFTQV